MRPWVIVTDGMQRKTLAAVRGLSEAGFRVAAGETSLLASALFSRRCRFRFRYTHPRENEGRFLRDLEAVVRRFDARVLLPMEEETIEACLRHRERFEPRTVLPFPDLDLFRRLGDKWEMYQVARKAGVPVPETRLLTESEVHRPESRADASTSTPTADYGLGTQDWVVKPRRGRGAAGVRYGADAAALRELAARHGELIVSERLKGEGAAVSLLMDGGGGVRALFTHRQLREYPVTGGASTLRESWRCPDMEESAVRMLRAAGWRGVALLEFRRDLRDGRFKLLDVNPRFWGSLALTIRSGVNMPALLCETVLGEASAPPPAYATGRRARWLLPGDLLHLLHATDRLALFPQFLRADPEDTFAWDDPAPTFGLAASLIPYFRRRLLVEGSESRSV